MMEKVLPNNSCLNRKILEASNDFAKSLFASNFKRDN